MDGVNFHDEVIKSMNNDDPTLAIAYMYAWGCVRYGVDVTQTVATATENVEQLRKAEQYGYERGLGDRYTLIDEIRANVIEQYDQFISEHSGTIGYMTTRPYVKIDGVRVPAKDAFLKIEHEREHYKEL